MLLLQANHIFTFEQTVILEDMVTFVCGIITGIILGIWYITTLFKKIKLDYELPDSTMFRIKHKNKDWLVANPKNPLQGFELLFIYLFRKKGKGDIHYEVTAHEKKRARIIMVIIVAIVIVLVAIGLYYSLFNVHYKKDFLPLEPNS
jgi:hypothetical protein